MNIDFPLASIVASSKDVIIVMNAALPHADSEREIIYVNDTFIHLFGYSRDEMVGKSPMLIWGPKTNPETERSIQLAMQKKEPIRVEVVYYTRGGEPCWLDSSTIPLYDDSGILTHFAIIARDLTVQKRLKTNCDQFFVLSCDLLCIAGFDGYFKQLNPAWEQSLGYSLHELYSRRFLDFVHPEDRLETARATAALSLGGALRPFENRYIAKDRTYRWLLWSAVGNPDEGLIYAVAQDITERKASEYALAESEQRYRSVVSGMAEGLVLHDSYGFIVECNTSAQHILGLSRDELVGRTSLYPRWRAILPDGSSLPDTSHPTMVSLRTGQPVNNFIMGFVKPNDETTWLAINTHPLIRTFEATPYGAVTTFHDITEQINIDRLKAEFISTVSHELRTPLTSIRGALGLLGSLGLPAMNTQLLELVQLATKNCDRLMYLINDLLDMEKMASGQVEFNFSTIALADLLSEALHANEQYGAKFGVTFTARGCDQSILVSVDRGRLLQVFANLLSNAAKYSPAKGIVSVLTEAIGDESVRVSVSDQGPGIPADFSKRIFQKFAQADSSDTRKKGGTGLGLAITKALIEKHGGTIGFCENKPQGITFYFELPRVKPTVIPPKHHPDLTALPV